MVLLNLFGGRSGKMSELEYLARIAHGEIPGAKIKHIGPIEISEGLGLTGRTPREFEKTVATVPDEKDWYLISWNYRYYIEYADSLTFNFGDSAESMIPRRNEDHAGELRGVKAEAGTGITVDAIQSPIYGANNSSIYRFRGLVSMTVLELPAGESPEL